MASKAAERVLEFVSDLNGLRAGERERAIAYLETLFTFASTGRIERHAARRSTQRLASDDRLVKNGARRGAKRSKGPGLELPPGYITAKEAGELLGMTTHYIRRLCQRHQIAGKPYKINGAHTQNGRLLLLERASVDRFRKERA